MPAEIIKKQLIRIPSKSGVYRFIDDKDNILYIGKAKDLKKRISSYLNINQLSTRILRMINLAINVEFIQTKNEVEALLLENNLIKKHQPKFNILLKDDKTFPQILISNHNYPKISKYRGQKQDQGHYFGPFASTYDVNKTINILRKVFKIRNCSDQEFSRRKTPCLEYQIKKCSAPCVNYIDKKDYKSSINNALSFLNGKTKDIQDQLSKDMIKFSNNLDYEKAAQLRDQIKSLNSIQYKQNINLSEGKDFDIIIAKSINDSVIIYISFYRSGQNFGARPYFFKKNEDSTDQEILKSFIGQFYITQKPAKNIIINQEIEDGNIISSFLSKLLSTKVNLILPKKGLKHQLVLDYENIALQNLERKISHNLNNKQLLMEVKKLFNLKKIPQKIEVYDNSHTFNSNAIGALITAGVDGFIKSGYRKFNIAKLSQLTNKDDTAMLKEVLLRRFDSKKLNKNSKKYNEKFNNYPDFIIIDGGKGQLNAANEIFNKLNIKIPFIAMSKGKKRNAGEEWFHQINKESFTIDKNDPVMYYLQRLRDEAHRFAIMTHRKKRDKAMIKS